MITHVFFDAGNTLVYVNMEVVSRALARRGLRLSAQELWRAEHRARRIVDDPDVISRSNDRERWTLYFVTILKECGIERPRWVAPVLAELEAYHRQSNLWETVPAGLPLLLDRLRSRYRLGVISNSNGTVRQKLHRVGLAPYFDVILDSHEEGLEKPDPRIFRAALERTWARPQDSLHVGDLYHVDVVGARAAGMRTLLLDPAGLHADKPGPRVSSIEAAASFLLL